MFLSAPVIMETGNSSRYTAGIIPAILPVVCW